MGRNLALILLAVSACAPDALDDPRSFCGGKCDGISVPRDERHVHLIHVDGLRPDLLEEMLAADQLPHLRSLVDRGKVSYRAATVDKSETMKVIQSYLTSRLDTEVVAWWQFSRADFRFRNYWMDQAEVVNYAIGTEFPLRPTILDFLAHQDETLTAGMSLARRGVPFKNYGRAYYEGLSAVYDHTYFNQADATMTAQLNVLRRIAEDPQEALPRLSVSLLAPADEFAHLEGVGGKSDERQYCFGRDKIHEAVFQILERDAEEDGPLADHLREYFTRVKRSFWTGQLTELCIAVPSIVAHSDPTGVSGTTIGEGTEQRVAPHYALALMVVDMELGRLFDTLKSIRVLPHGQSRWEPGTEQRDSLFDRTLFIIFGDHGMVDSKHYMAPPRHDAAAEFRHSDSLGVDFLDYLNRALGLETPTTDVEALGGSALGVNYQRIPAQLATPSRFAGPEVADLVGEARSFARGMFRDIEAALASELHETYWWLLFLKSVIIDPRLAAALEPHRDTAITILTELLLRAEPRYLDAETSAIRAIYDQQVRLVYGGGALNNAELFLPVCDGASCSWTRRPTFEEIMATRGPSGAWLMDVLRANPGVALIFVRRNNDEFVDGAPTPAVTEIAVMDVFDNRGTITVFRDAMTGQLVFRYRVEADSLADPLGHGALGLGEGTVGTYDEWNARGIDEDHYYHNVVGGIGTYLYQNNPAVGDVLVMHAQGWNFGDNGGGHGGVHQEEKLTAMIVAGPGTNRGELMATARYRSAPDGKVGERTWTTYPTLLDVMPTALAWLGYSEDEFAAFARDDFAAYLRAWTREQRADIVGHLGTVEDIEQVLEMAGFDGFRIERFKKQLERLFGFVGARLPDVPEQDGLMMGNRLILD